MSGQDFFVITGATTNSRTGEPHALFCGGRLRIYWGRSLSHRSARTDLEADVLARLVERTEPAAIDLVTFASAEPQVATVLDAAALRTALSRVTYRGGTSHAGLGALPLPAASQCVLVFDGEVTVDRGARSRPTAGWSHLPPHPAPAVHALAG